MFKRFSVIALVALLGTISSEKVLQAMYIPDLWEDIWDEDKQRRQKKVETEREKLVKELQSDSLLADIVQKVTSFCDDLSYQEKQEELKSLYDFFMKFAQDDINYNKNLLIALCKQSSSGFEYLPDDKIDLDRLKSEFNRIMASDSQFNHILSKVIKGKTQLLMLLKSHPLSGIVLGILLRHYSLSICGESNVRLTFTPIMLAIFCGIDKCIYYNQPDKQMSQEFIEHSLLPFLTDASFLVLQEIDLLDKIF